MTTITMTTTTTEHGLDIDLTFADPADQVAIDRAVDGLRSKGYAVHVVDTAAEARALIGEILPTDASVFTSSSETLRLSGIDADINESGRFNAMRPHIFAAAADGATPDDMRRLAAAPDYVVGSVHAVTEDGRMLTASGSGSQLSHYSYTAGSAIFVVGSQKIVPDVTEGLRRLETYAYPMEDTRFRAAVDAPAQLNKILIVNGEMFDGRVTVVLIREAIGF